MQNGRVPWNEAAGQVTLSFDEWVWTEREIRAFLRWTADVCTREYDRLWDEAQQAPAAPDEEAIDIIWGVVGGLLPHDHDWMLRSATVKDAVTAFEVYLEKASAEVLGHYGAAWPKEGRAPHWGQLRDFFGNYLDVDIEPDHVDRVRRLRHNLTHMRGELRTDEQRRQFHSPGDGASMQATLTDDGVVAMLDDLARTVRDVDVVAWAASRGPRDSQRLRELAGSPS